VNSRCIQIYLSFYWALHFFFEKSTEEPSIRSKQKGHISWWKWELAHLWMFPVLVSPVAMPRFTRMPQKWQKSFSKIWNKIEKVVINYGFKINAHWKEIQTWSQKDLLQIDFLWNQPSYKITRPHLVWTSTMKITSNILYSSYSTIKNSSHELKISASRARGLSSAESPFRL